jgi:hypothetical protein
VDRQSQREFPLRFALTGDTIYRTIKKFEVTGNVNHKLNSKGNLAYLFIRKKLSVQQVMQQKERRLAQEIEV